VGFGVGAADGVGTAGEAWANRGAAAWEVEDKTSAGVSGADFRASEALVGPAATTANPTRGRTANGRREPALGRRAILRGLAPAMEEERLLRRSRESG